MTDEPENIQKALDDAKDELQRAQAKIVELEQRLDVGEQLVNAGSFQMDWDTLRVHWSDNNLRLFGVTREEFGKNYHSITEFIHPEDRPSFDRTMARVIATRTDYDHAHRIIRADGVVRHVRECATTLGGPDGNVFVGTTQDITELVETRVAEAKLEAMVQVAGEIAQVGGWRVDLATETVEITPVTASFHNLPELRQMSLQKAFGFYTEESSSRLQAGVARCVETGADLDETLTLVSATGQRRIVRVIGRGERDQTTGAVNALVGAVQDITAVTEAQATTDRLNQFVRMAGRLAQIGGWRVDLDPLKVTWSAETARIHGMPDDYQPSLDAAFNFYAPEYRERIEAIFSACAEHGKSFDEVMEVLTADGQRVWVRVIGEPMRNASRQIVAVEGVLKDISELVASRETSEELLQRLHRTLDNISDGFLLIDEHWNFSFVNRQAEILLQRSAVDLLGTGIWDAFPETVGSSFQQQYERVVAEGGSTRFVEYFAPLAMWIEVDASLTPDGLAVYFRDVTGQRKRDQQLRLLEAATGRLNDILLITEAEPIDGPDGPKIVFVNDAFERRTGFSREEALGNTPRILQGPKTQRAELDRIRNAMEKWKPVRAELINYTKAGEEFWLELDIVPLADERGWYTHWVAIERDITDRKLADQQVWENERRFRLISKSAGSTMWEWDAASNLKWWSEGLQEIFGHVSEAGDIRPSVWRRNVHPDAIARIDKAFDRLLSGQNSVFKEIYRFRRADGTWATVEDNGFAIHDEKGTIERVLGTLTDVTERSELEDRLRQVQKMDAVGQLTAGIAHDFNNLLTIMMGNSEVLVEELNESPNLQRNAQMTLEAVDRAADMTGQLLAFSRKQVLEPKVIDISQLVQRMDGLLRRTLPETINVEIIRGAGLWTSELDPGQLENSLLNLVLNARDAMPDGGKLTIEMSNASIDADYAAREQDVKPGQYVMLVISDTGCGIAPDIMDRLFEPFFTTKAAGQGSGLGLSMIYGFVKQSGGHIKGYSELDEGTTFKLYFPRAFAANMEDQPASPSKRLKGGTETILVVEDDSAVRDHVVLQLEGLGYGVLQAASGKQALEILQNTNDIALLFTDVVMPGGMSGRDLAEAACVSHPSLKVLFTSGYTENSIVHHGRLDPGVELLSKPYRRDQLAAKLRNILD